MLFLIIKYIVVALIIAYFTIVLARRKKVDIELKGEFLEHKLQAYVRIHTFLVKTQDVIASPIYLEHYYQTLINGTPFKIGDQKMEYSSFFNSFEKFDAYQKELKDIISWNSIYLDYSLENILLEMQCWIEDIHDMLSAFIKTERDGSWKFSQKQQEDHINLACQIFGIVLQNDINNFSHKINNKLARRLQHPRLGKWYHESCFDKFLSKLSEYCEKRADGKSNRKKSLLQLFYLYILHPAYGCSQFNKYPSFLIVVLAFIHWSDKYTRDEFDELELEKRAVMINGFHKCFIKYYG